jgi:hypothetical protein
MKVDIENLRKLWEVACKSKARRSGVEEGITISMARYHFLQEVEAFMPELLIRAEAVKIIERDGVEYYRWNTDSHDLKVGTDREKTTPNEESKVPLLEIPTDLEDCFRILKEWAGPEDIEEFKKSNPVEYHHSMGRLLRNEWRLWHNPEGGIQETGIHKYMVELGLHHADDMSGLILESFHKHLHGLPLDVEGQVAKYKEYWAEQELK